YGEEESIELIPGRKGKGRSAEAGQHAAATTDDEDHDPAVAGTLPRNDPVKLERVWSESSHKARKIKKGPTQPPSIV
ncbi:hypothetical protein FRC17_007343, partial [Serendipita sp. 399]